MESSKVSSTLLLLFFVVFVTFSIVSAEEKKHQNKQTTKLRHKHHKCKGGSDKNTPDSQTCHAPSRCAHNGPHPPPFTTFSILSFGAKGDGVTDDAQAIEAAWHAACTVKGAKVEIPSGLKFLINPITLPGPCMSDLVLQIDGTLLAPSTVHSWPTSNLSQLINFKWPHNFTIQGTGVVDGQGFVWWNITSQANYLQKKSEHIPNKKPTALRFYCGNNVTVRDIKIVNSPQFHLKFDSSEVIKVHNISISSPDNSTNTDGIHLQNTRNVEIHNSNISCGDDCVSIQTGCSNVHVHHIHCGPGHGISLGGLGEKQSFACVSNIVVNDISFQSTDSGVRIKTWPGGKGSVKNVSFSNIEVSNVKVPLVIDQNYCDKNKICKNNQTRGAVAISGVKYDRIIGTYLEQPIHLNCSNDTPCTDVELIDIQLNPPSVPAKKKLENALCRNSYGKSKALLVPSSIDCLGRDGGPVNIAKSHKNMC